MAAADAAYDADYANAADDDDDDDNDDDDVACAAYASRVTDGHTRAACTARLQNFTSS